MLTLSSCHFYFHFSLVSQAPVHNLGHRKYKVLVKLLSITTTRTPETENAKGQYVEIHSGVLAGNSKHLGSGPCSTTYFLCDWGKDFISLGFEFLLGVWII